MVDTIAQSSSEKKAGKAVGSFRNLSENHNRSRDERRQREAHIPVVWRNTELWTSESSMV